jgi:D-glycero-D-manno-heptose 1,7-bisphosphate phosphatase
VTIILLDRDGVINQNGPGYTSQFANWVWCDGAVQAMYDLELAGHLLFIVSNQSGVARGYFTEQRVCELMRDVSDDCMRQTGRPLPPFYACYHGPWDECGCRKPLSGLWHKIQQDHSVAISEHMGTTGVVVGDSSVDGEFADNIGFEFCHITAYGVPSLAKFTESFLRS